MTKKEVGNMESAPANAKYVTTELDPTLTNERVVQAGPGMIITDEGADQHVVFTSFLPYAEDTSLEANTFSVELDPAPESYYTGLAFSIKAANTTTGPSLVSIDGLGVKVLKKTNGLDIGAGDIMADQVVVVLYDGTNFVLISAVATAPAPAPHATTHAAAGSDPVSHNTLASLQGGGTGDFQHLTLTQMATLHSLSDSTPLADSGAGAPGTATTGSRSDHIHPNKKLDDLAVPDDNTDLDASASLHGLMPKWPISIAAGGTGQTTAQNAINALANGNTVSAASFKTGSGTVSAAPSTWYTIVTATAGTYIVGAYQSGSLANYSAVGIIISDGSTAKIAFMNVGPSMGIGVSGLNIQIRQTGAGTVTLAYHYMKIA